MILNGLRVEALLLGLVIENFGNNDLRGDVSAVLVWSVRSAVCCVALGKTRRIAETSWVEEGVRLVNASVDIPNLDAGACRGPAARGAPSPSRIDDLIALAQVRMIKDVRLDSFDHGRVCNRLKSCPVELHSDSVERDIVLACNFCSGRICSQPFAEIVPSSS